MNKYGAFRLRQKNIFHMNINILYGHRGKIMNRIIKICLPIDVYLHYAAGNQTPNTSGQLAGRTEEEKKKKIPNTSHQPKGATGHYIPHPSRGREGGRTPPTTHPPSSSPALPVPPMGRGNAHKSSQGSG
jgi:hypothetical protein